MFRGSTRGRFRVEETRNLMSPKVGDDGIVKRETAGWISASWQGLLRASLPMESLTRVSQALLVREKVFSPAPEMD